MGRQVSRSSQGALLVRYGETAFLPDFDALFEVAKLKTPDIERRVASPFPAELVCSGSFQAILVLVCI